MKSTELFRNAQSVDLDGALALGPSARGALRNDLYEVDALFDFARSASR